MRPSCSSTAVKMEIDIAAARFGGDVVGPLEGDVGAAGESGLVIHLAMDFIGEGLREVGHRGALGGEDLAGVRCVDVPIAVGALSLVELDPGAALGDDEVVGGHHFGLKVSLQVEAVGEQEDEHGLDLTVGQLGHRAAIRRDDFGFDVEVGGVDRAGEAGDHVGFDVVGKLDEHVQRDVGRG